MLRRFLRTREGFRSMHPEWPAALHNTTALGYVYGHVYGDVALMDRVVALATRYCKRREAACTGTDGLF